MSILQLCKQAMLDNPNKQAGMRFFIKIWPKKLGANSKNMMLLAYKKCKTYRCKLKTMEGFVLTLDSEKIGTLNTTSFFPTMPYKANHYHQHFGFLALHLKKRELY